MGTGKPVTGFKTGNRFGKWETGNRFRPSTYFYLRDLEMDRRRGRKGGVTGRTRRRSRPMTELHRRLRTINIAGSGAHKTAGAGTGERDRGSTTAIGLRTTGRGITASPPVGHRWTIVDVAGGCVRETAGSGHVSGAVAHLSKSRRAARQRDAGLKFSRIPPDLRSDTFKFRSDTSGVRSTT